MATARAIELNEKNLNFIANTGVISRADIQALYEAKVVPLKEPHYFVIDYTDANGEQQEWTATSFEFFNQNFRWTESPTAGFRHCRVL